MSLEHSPSRDGRLARVAQPSDPMPVTLAAYTVNQFCQAHSISRSKLYEMWKDGIGPRFFNAGIQRRISAEAAAEWRAAREAAAQSQTA